MSTDTQALVLARIAEVDRMDEDQIVQELAGDQIAEYVYQFPMDGKQVKGLSWAGYKELAIRWGNLRIERPQVDETPTELRALVEVTDLEHNVTVWAGAHQPKARRIGGRDGAPTRHVADDYAFEKVISKAQRNALKNVIPHAIQQAAIDAVTAGKAIPSGRTSSERPAVRSSRPRGGALPAGQRVDEATGEIQDGARLGSKGDVMQWYKTNHDIGMTEIAPHFPRDKRMNDLTPEELQKAAEAAVKAKSETSPEERARDAADMFGPPKEGDETPEESPEPEVEDMEMVYTLALDAGFPNREAVLEILDCKEEAVLENFGTYDAALRKLIG